jgi:hypothetical protein
MFIEGKKNNYMISKITSIKLALAQVNRFNQITKKSDTSKHAKQLLKSESYVTDWPSLLDTGKYRFKRKLNSSFNH